MRDLVFLLCLAQQTAIHPNQLRQDLPIVAHGLMSTDPGPARFYLTAGPAPTDTVALDQNGKPTVMDAVLFMDSADNLLKWRRFDGQVFVVGQ